MQLPSYHYFLSMLLTDSSSNLQFSDTELSGGEPFYLDLSRASGRGIKWALSWAVFSKQWSEYCYSTELCDIWGAGQYVGYSMGIKLGGVWCGRSVPTLALLLFCCQITPIPATPHPCLFSWFLSRANPLLFLSQRLISPVNHQPLIDFLGGAFLSF